MACEKCWADAYWRWHTQPDAVDVDGLPKAQADHYHDLLAERKNDPCTEYEQRHGTKVNDFRENPVGVNAVAAAPAEEPLGEGRLF